MILHWCAENPSFFHSFFSPPLCSFPSQSSSVRRRRRRSHPQSTHNLSQLLTQQLQQLQWTKPMSAFRPPSSCFPLQLNFCSQNAERTSLVLVLVCVCVWTSGSSTSSQKGWLFKDKSADE
jgi:hypothetical protein